MDAELDAKALSPGNLGHLLLCAQRAKRRATPNAAEHAQHSPRDAAASRPPHAMVPPRLPRAKNRSALEWPVPCVLPAAAARALNGTCFHLSAAASPNQRGRLQVLLPLLRARIPLLPRRDSNHRP